MKRFGKNLMRAAVSCAAVIALLFGMTACKQFTADIDEELSYWAAEVIAADYSFDEPTQAADGVLCIPSAHDVTITIKLHNPRKFTLITPTPTSSAADVQNIINFHGLSMQPTYDTDYTLERTPDKAALKLTYDSAFLKNHEWSNGAIGPEITLTSKDGRKFGKKFSLNLKADTAPPKPSVTLAQTTTIPKYYVLCLQVPDMDETVTGEKLHKDMKHIKINGTKYELKINGGGSDFIKPADSAFIGASEVEKLPIPGADNPPTGAWVLYYQTDVKAEYGAEENYTITLIDEQGLVSEELKPTAKAEFPAFYVRGTNGAWYTDNVPDAAEGNDISGDGSKEKPYATVTKALTQCTQNDIPYIILTDGETNENNTLNLESGKTVTIASLRKTTPAIIHDARSLPSTSGPERYLVTTAGTLTLDSVILKAGITGTHNMYGFIANSWVYGIKQTGGTVTVKGEAAQVRNFAHAVTITGGTFTMEAGSIYNNYINGGEAGVNISGGTFVLSGGSIKDNKATNNVGVSISSGTFTMTDGKISGNRAYCFGGGISAYGGTVEISGGTINNNHAAEGPFGYPTHEDVGGGGIYIKGGTVNFKGGTIKDNFLDGADKNCGAGVFVEGGGTFNMTGGTIKGCKTDPDIISPELSKGGGVYVGNSGLAELSNCAIENCTADLGGGIGALGTVKLTNTSIKTCTATSTSKGGGAVYAKDATVTMTKCTLTGNKADNGGGVYAEKGSTGAAITIKGGTIGGMVIGEANKAVGTDQYHGVGGGIYNGLGCTLKLENNSAGVGCIVIGNTAKTGGGIGGSGTVEIKGTSKILNNKATESGGGIDSPKVLTVSGNAEIKGNKVTGASGKGGGVYNASTGQFNFNGGTIGGNTAATGSGVYVKVFQRSGGITGKMTMSGSAKVEASNDVYLDEYDGSIPYTTNTYITVTGRLNNTLAATLTMKNEPGLTIGYQIGRVVVKGTSDYTLKDEDKKKFPITSQNWTTELDIVNNTLKLKQ